MTDLFGKITFPVTAPTLASTDAAGDPLLTLLGSFLRTVVTTECGAAWDVLFPGELPVARVLFRDPNEGVFDDRDLPALFLFRNSQNLERIADDWSRDLSEIVALWIPPPSTLDRLSDLAPFVNSIVKAMDRSLTNGYHPSWVAPADTSPNAALFGSDLTVQARLFKLITAVRVSRVPIITDTVDNSQPRRYLGARATFSTEELLERDPTAYPDATISSLAAAVLNEEGDVMVETQSISAVASGSLPPVAVSPPGATAVSL